MNSATLYSQELKENDGGRHRGQSKLQVAPAVLSEEESKEGHGGRGHAPHGGPDQRAQRAVLSRKPLYANGGRGRHYALQQITQVVVLERCNAIENRNIGHRKIKVRRGNLEL